MIEVGVPIMILLLCKIRKDVGNLYKWQTFWPSSLRPRQISHVKSGADEGYWAETSAIYTNHQHLRGFYTKENLCGNARFDRIISYLL